MKGQSLSLASTICPHIFIQFFEVNGPDVKPLARSACSVFLRGQHWRSAWALGLFSVQFPASVPSHRSSCHGSDDRAYLRVFGFFRFLGIQSQQPVLWML